VPPPKKVPETDAIFDQLQEVHAHAAESDPVLRVSLDAKATIKIGPFSRGGSSRTGTTAADHDFQPDGTLTPFGLFLPDHDELNLYFTASKVTSDFIVDTLDEWWLLTQARFPQTQVLLLNLDNGPENQSHRSQFMYRLVQFAQKHRIMVRLAYYPPYHSKYNPIERCWGALENYWRGELLDSTAAILGYASRMTYNGRHPQVQHCQRSYASGVRRTMAEQRHLEKYLERLPGLGRWFIDIPPPSLDEFII
jgi:transposase